MVHHGPTANTLARRSAVREKSGVCLVLEAHGKHDLQASAIGRHHDSGHLRVADGGHTTSDLPKDRCLVVAGHDRRVNRRKRLQLRLTPDVARADFTEVTLRLIELVALLLDARPLVQANSEEQVHGRPAKPEHWHDRIVEINAGETHRRAAEYGSKRGDHNGNAQRLPVGDKDDGNEEEGGERAGNRTVYSDERADSQGRNQRDGCLGCALSPPVPGYFVSIVHCARHHLGGFPPLVAETGI